MSGAATAIGAPAAPAGRRLPPGPRSRAWTGARWLTRPAALLEECQRRYGDAFTLNYPGAGESIMLADPAAVKEVFTRDRHGNGTPRTRDLMLRERTFKVAKSALEGDDKGSAKLKVTASDAVGNETSRQRKVKVAD